MFVYIIQTLDVLRYILETKQERLSEAGVLVNPSFPKGTIPISPLVNWRFGGIMSDTLCFTQPRNPMDIGIFGGSFNPIHIGHLIVAEEVFQLRALSKVIFIPTGLSPHKESMDLIDSIHRYQMVTDAIGDNKHFEVSDIEIKRSGKSYTIDTIRSFKEIYGEKDNLYLIMGTDMLNEISTWKDISVLSEMCHFIVVNRSPTSISKDLSETAFPREELRGIKAFSKKKITEIEKLKVTIPLIGISSTEIRARLRSGHSIRYLVPRCVENYIKANNLYIKVKTVNFIENH